MAQYCVYCGKQFTPPNEETDWCITCNDDGHRAADLQRMEEKAQLEYERELCDKVDGFWNEFKKAWTEDFPREMSDMSAGQQIKEVVKPNPPLIASIIRAFFF